MSNGGFTEETLLREESVETVPIEIESHFYKLSHNFVTLLDISKLPKERHHWGRMVDRINNDLCSCSISSTIAGISQSEDVIILKQLDFVPETDL